MSLNRSIGAPSGVSPFAPENGAKRIRPSGARAKKARVSATILPFAAVHVQG